MTTYQKIPSKGLLLGVFIYFLLAGFGSVHAQTLSIDPTSVVTEGTTLTLQVSTSTPVSKAFKVNIVTDDVSTEGKRDYSLVTKELSFDVGDLTKEIKISIVDDSVAEGKEEFKISMDADLIGVDASALCTVTIQDDDKAHVSISDARVLEGENAVFKLTLDIAVEDGFELEVVFDNGSAVGDTVQAKKKKQETKDFLNSRQLILFEGKAGEEQFLSVPTFKDKQAESAEDFEVSIASGAIPDYIIVDGSGHGIIDNFTRQWYHPSDAFLDTVEQFTLGFYGNGNIQTSFEDGAGIPASTGVGLTLTKYFKHLRQKKFGPFYRADLNARINIASSVDTLVANIDTVGMMVNGDPVLSVSNSNEFGGSILTPLNSGQAADLQLRLYNYTTWLGLISGLEFRYVGSNRNWEFGQNVIQSSSNMFRVLIFHDLVNYDKRDNYSVMIKLGYAANSIRGDITQGNNEMIREVILGREEARRTYHGLEFGANFRVKNIQADFAYTLFPTSADKQVSGLTGSRIITTISFVGGFGVKLE